MKTYCDVRPKDFMELNTEGSEVYIQVFDNLPGYEMTAEILLTDGSKVEALRDALTEWLERNSDV